MITAGGEAGFVQRIVEESLLVGTRCRYASGTKLCLGGLADGHCRFYTSLLGKHSTIAAIVSILKSHKVRKLALNQSQRADWMQIDNYGLTEFVQGQTRRWGIVWSLGEERLPDVSTLSTMSPY